MWGCSLGDRAQRTSVRIGQKSRQHFHVVRESELPVLCPAEFAQRNEAVDVAQPAVECAGVTPELRWPVMVKYTFEAFAAGARLAIVPPEHVSRADEPVLPCRIELYSAPHLEHTRSTYR